MVNAIIVEDERYTLEYIQGIVRDTGFINVYGVYDNPVEVLEKANAKLVQIAFIDIEMPEMDGLSLAEKLLEQNPAMHIVFITAYSQYAVQAFDLNALDYLMKPINVQRFNKMTEKLKKTIGEELICNKTLSIQCFGNFEVKVNGNPVKWQRAKAEELFAYLLTNRSKKIHKDIIIEELWPEYEPAKALVILQTSICKLRNIFSSLNGLVTISYEGSKYSLNIEDCECDLFWMEKTLDSFLSDDISRYSVMEKACITLEKGLLKQNGYIWSHAREEELYQHINGILRKLMGKCRSEGKREIGLKFGQLVKRLQRDEE